MAKLDGKTAAIVATPPHGETGYHHRPYWPAKIVAGRFGTTVPFLMLVEGQRHVLFGRGT
jgi:hypothetical protein